jgi:cephalosporin hydroxylase
VTLDEIFVQRCSVWSDIVDHLPYLYDTVVESNAQTVVELGVRSGNSTAAFMAAVQKTGGHLWSVDVAIPSWPQEFYGTGFSSLIIGNDLDFGVADQLPDQIDVLFVDTNHWFHHTLEELRLYGPRARTILLHDTELEAPFQAPADDPKFPVSKAIDTWCAEVGRNWVNRTGCYGLGVVTKGW